MPDSFHKRVAWIFDGVGDEELIADFSINAVRRFGLEEGRSMTIELPQDRLMVFSPEAG